MNISPSNPSRAKAEATADVRPLTEAELDEFAKRRGGVERLVAEVRRGRATSSDTRLGDAAEGEMRRLRAEVDRVQGENARLLQRVLDSQGGE